MYYSGNNAKLPSESHYHKNGLKMAEVWRNRDGKSHRIDGPAKRWDRISNWDEFWLDGKEYFFKNWIEIAKEHISHERYIALIEQYGKKDDGER